MKEKIRKFLRKPIKGSLTIETIIVTPIIFILIFVTLFLIIYPAVQAANGYEQAISYDLYDYNTYKMLYPGEE